METCKQYEQWTENQLNQRILALYNQIQQVTLQNLEIAQKNCELEVQVKTIDEIIQSYPDKTQTKTLSTYRSQQSFQLKYDTLLHDHKKLINRVNKIEEVLFAGTHKKSIFAKEPKSTMSKVTSIHDIVAKSQRRTATKIKNNFRQSNTQNSSRCEENIKKPRYY